MGREFSRSGPCSARSTRGHVSGQPQAGWARPRASRPDRPLAAPTRLSHGLGSHPGRCTSRLRVSRTKSFPSARPGSHALLSAIPDFPLPHRRVCFARRVRGSQHQSPEPCPMTLPLAGQRDGDASLVPVPIGFDRISKFFSTCVDSASARQSVPSAVRESFVVKLL